MRLCRAKQCNTTIRSGMFCPRHWGMLPASFKERLADSYETPQWERRLLDAIQTVALVEAKRDETHPRD